jgi:hypothetical protein
MSLIINDLCLTNGFDNKQSNNLSNDIRVFPSYLPVLIQVVRAKSSTAGGPLRSFSISSRRCAPFGFASTRDLHRQWVFMNRVDRLLALMAAHFELSARTIYRDLAALGQSGVRIVAESGVGYTLMRGYHLPPVNFTTEEASALATGGLLVEQFADAAVKAQMHSALLSLFVFGLAVPIRLHPRFYPHFSWPPDGNGSPLWSHLDAPCPRLVMGW